MADYRIRPIGAAPAEIRELIEALPGERDLIEFHNSEPLILYRRALSAVTAVLDARDPYTADHSQRVGTMAGRLAAALRFPSHLRELAETAGLVHDIGKVAMPDRILFKEGKLSNEDWQQMRRHPEAGETIIRKAGRLDNIAQTVRSHHERWDGTGYPDGLKGREIPYLARILALCDSADAMMSDRVYRPSLGKERTQGQIAEYAGRMYQPALARFFLDHWEEITRGLYVPR